MARALSVAGKRRSNAKRRTNTTTRRRPNTTRGQTRKTARKAYSKRRGNTSVARRNNASKQLQNMKVRANAMAEKYRNGVEVSSSIAGTQLALAGTAAASGYWGPSKMKIEALGNFGDLRLIAGGTMVALGVFDAFKGKSSQAGMGVLSIGQGVLGAYVYEMAHNFGLEKAAAKGSIQLGTPGAPYSTGRSKIQGDFGREVYVTPSTAGRAGLGYRG